jgi:penicillin-binding protein 1B
LAKKKKPKPKKKAARKKAGAIRRWVAGLLVVGFLLGTILLATLDVIVRAKFSGAKWALPSHVYSRALELYEGQALDKGQLLWELEKLGYRPVTALKSAGQYRSSAKQIEIYLRPFKFWDGDQYAQRVQVHFDQNIISKVRDGSNKPLPLARLEPLLIGGIYPDHMEDREPVTLESLPPYLVESLIAVEDRDFYRHWGISPRGIARALLGNIRSGGVSQGGSTLTQQLVKNFYLSRERTLLRKGIEAIMAVLLEIHYSKGEILEAYVNEIYLGQSGKRAIHGFGMASYHYFRQPLNELDLRQVALLTALVKGASHYNPRRHPERALQRRNLVIDLLEDQQLIDGRQARVARDDTLGISTKAGTNTGLFPTYIDFAKRQLRTDFEDAGLRSEGLRIFTSFDPQLQNLLQRTISRQLTELERQKNIDKNSLQAAAIIVRVGTGEVVATAGSRQSGFAGFNRALDARRPVGSIIKPAVYLTALQQPERYTLSTVIDDEPLIVTTDNGETWQPQNFDRRSHGDTPLYVALSQSYNQSTARLGMNLGIDKIASTIRALGHQRPLPRVPALTLGAATMSPMEVATLYHTIASDGFYTPLGGIESVYTAQDVPLKRYPYQIEGRFQPTTMHLLQYVLQVVMREGTGKGAYKVLPPDIVLAGKTGTSNGQRDSWFAGFGGNYLIVVWVGRDDNGKMPITGSSGALNIWSRVVAGIGVSSLAFTRPEGVTYHWIDPGSGLLAGQNCQGARNLPYVDGSAPTSYGACGKPEEQDVVDWLKDIFSW